MNAEEVSNMSLGEGYESFEDWDVSDASENSSEANATEELQPENSATVTATNQTSFVCDICSKDFLNEGSLKKHLPIHDTKDCVCEICNKVLSNKLTLGRHLRYHEKSKGFKCEICDKMFYSQSYVKTHQQMIHYNERKFTCEICSNKFKSRSTLQRHYLTHTKERPFVCEFCNRGFTHRGALNVHLLTHPQSSVKRESYSCEICNKTFPKKYRLDNHLLMHSDEKPYACEICDKSFRHMTSLKDHLKSHRGEKRSKGLRVTCGMCNKTMLQESFSLHMKSHLNGRTHVCPICDKTFFQNAHLQSHIATHTDERPFSCEICQQRFTRKYHVKVHLKTHTKNNIQTNPTDKETIPCEICLRRFPNKMILAKHLQIHVVANLEGNGFSCKICGIRIVKKEYIRWHMLSHTQGESSIFCQNLPGEKQNTEDARTDPFKQNCPISDDNRDSQKRYFCQRWNLQLNHPAFSNYSLKWELCKESFTTELELQKHLLTHTNTHSFSFPQNYINQDLTTESNLKMVESVNIWERLGRSTVCEKQGVESVWNKRQASNAIHDRQSTKTVCEGQDMNVILKVPSTDTVSDKQNIKNISEIQISNSMNDNQNLKTVQNQETSIVNDKQNTDSTSESEKKRTESISVSGKRSTKSQKRYFCQRWNLQENYLTTYSGNNSLRWELCKESFNTEAELKEHLFTHTNAHSFSFPQNYMNGDQNTESNLKMLESVSICERLGRSTVCEKQGVESVWNEKQVSNAILDKQNTKTVCEGQNTNVILKVQSTETVSNKQKVKNISEVQNSNSMNDKQNTKTVQNQKTLNVNDKQNTESTSENEKKRTESISICEKQSTKSQKRYFCQRWNLQENPLTTYSDNSSLRWELCKESFNSESELKVHLLTHTNAHSFSFYQNYMNGNQNRESNLKMLESVSICERLGRSTVYDNQDRETVSDKQHLEVFRKNQVMDTLPDKQIVKVVSNNNTKFHTGTLSSPVCDEQNSQQNSRTMCDKQNTKFLKNQEMLNVCESRNIESTFVSEQHNTKSTFVSEKQSTESTFKCDKWRTESTFVCEKQSTESTLVCEKQSTESTLVCEKQRTELACNQVRSFAHEKLKTEYVTDKQLSGNISEDQATESDFEMQNNVISLKQNTNIMQKHNTAILSEKQHTEHSSSKKDKKFVCDKQPTENKTLSAKAVNNRLDRKTVTIGGNKEGLQMKYACHICNKKFSQRMHVQMHLFTHSK